MLRYIVGRLAAALALLVALSLMVFSLMHLAPGDLALTLIGNRRVTPEVVAAIREAHRLDDPFLAQYWHWLSGVLRGDFGTSVRTGSPVTVMIGDRLGYTALLAGMAAAISVVVGLPAGVAAARRPGRWLDRLVVSASVIGVSAPAFAVSLVLLYLLGLRAGWFPIYGTGDGMLDTLWHFALPAIALASGMAAMIVKITRASVSRELDQDYVTFARSRGIAPRAVRRLYLRNAAPPILASIGLTLTYLVGGAVLIEVTFALPGLGSLLVESISFKDVPVVQALTLLVAALVVLITLATDLAHSLADPQLRRGLGSSR